MVVGNNQTVKKKSTKKTTPTTKISELPLDSIRIDGGTQARVQINDDTVQDYCSDMFGSAEFPPAIVFFDGSDHWLADGFHRFLAAKRAHRDSLLVEIRDGAARDALLYAVGANLDHGLRRTNADKRHSIEILLKDEEWSGRARNWIAEQCRVSDGLVASVQSELDKLAKVSNVSTSNSGCCNTGQRATVGKDGKKRRKPKPRSSTPATAQTDAPLVPVSPVDPDAKLAIAGKTTPTNGNKPRPGRRVPAAEALYDGIHNKLQIAHDYLDEVKQLLASAKQSDRKKLVKLGCKGSSKLPFERELRRVENVFNDVCQGCAGVTGSCEDAAQ